LGAFKKIGEDAIRFILSNIILGLEELHKQGIIYCDLKPENILVFNNGYTKLTDFGLSKRTKEGDKVSVMLGSPLYVAP
jgi:serine/threonine protein kinase